MTILKVQYPNKVAGSIWSSNNANELKEVVNNNADQLSELVTRLAKILLSVAANAQSASDLSASLSLINHKLAELELMNVWQTVDGQQVVQRTEADAMLAVTDGEGNIAMKYDSGGFDVAELSAHIKTLIKGIPGLGLAIGITEGTAYDAGNGMKDHAAILGLQQKTRNISETDEDGFVFADEDGNVAFRVDGEGLDAALLSAHLQALIRAIPGLGGGGSANLLEGNLREIAEDGFYLVDSAGYIAAFYTNTSSYGFGGGSSYEVIKSINY